MVKISVIIPTFNRAKYLKDVLVSVQNQDVPMDEYEIIVVDNSPLGSVAQQIEEFNRNAKKEVIYVNEPKIGLHNAKHAGAKTAKGEFLAYLDDDVIVDKKWIIACKNFEDTNVHMIGGKIVPKWEKEPLAWIEAFWRSCEFGKVLGSLSLLDFGEETKQISPDYVYGCNMMIRKKILYKCGGFHPDAFPQKYIKYRGDGETGLAHKFKDKGYKAFYTPIAKVQHVINKERLTIKYFCQRAFNQGISDSFTEIKKNGGIKISRSSYLKRLKNDIDNIYATAQYFLNSQDVNAIKNLINRSYAKGRQYHLKEVQRDDNLLEYILKETWLNED